MAVERQPEKSPAMRGLRYTLAEELAWQAALDGAEAAGVSRTDMPSSYVALRERARLETNGGLAAKWDGLRRRVEQQAEIYRSGWRRDDPELDQALVAMGAVEGPVWLDPPEE